MHLFKNNDIRLLGIAIIVSAIMPMVYDVIPIIVQKGVVPDVPLKIYASLAAMLIGIGLLVYFDRTHKKTRKEKYLMLICDKCQSGDHEMKPHKFFIGGGNEVNCQCEKCSSKSGLNIET